MDLIAIITYLHKEKISKNISPLHVTEIELISEVCRRMRTEIDLLVKDGKVKEIRTLNDKAYII
ncbi:hypothetical protein [Parabacteroides sp. AM08-6]|uniref:hypothetical protein n=1 Tax=Parabacteroides sp. AM08-6 TaxID=2292053 RepID=UPI000F00EB75|nr:hypothetical protein [Parabacteroides sp. AM08-6]RHJ78082.1 hypothetical protein DW103_15230 [Parabacteroides sp. AM08-6]